MEGWVKTHRKMYENPIARKPAYFCIWMYLISHANFKESSIIYKNEKMIIHKGQCLTSLKSISNFYGFSLGTVSNVLKYLKSESQIETQTTNHFTVVTIKNYDEYQEVESKTEIQVKASRKPGESQVKHHKNVKNDKNVKKDTEGSPNYLTNLPEEDIKKFHEYYLVDESKVKEKAEALDLYCKTKGKTYKDYRAFLQSALLREYGKRIKPLAPKFTVEYDEATKTYKKIISSTLSA